jgi:hypothetical protein
MVRYRELCWLLVLTRTCWIAVEGSRGYQPCQDIAIALPNSCHWKLRNFLEITLSTVRVPELLRITNVNDELSLFCFPFYIDDA